MVIMRAPAKVNVSLRVLGKRADGYHEVITRMQKLDLCDTIELDVTKRSGILFSCSDKSLPHGTDNLAVRAAEVLLGAVGGLGRRGVSIKLTKAIPVAAGLGGGSSDAGTVLRGLNALLGTPLSRADVLRLAEALGADVPFFTSEAGAVLASGIGEKLHETTSLSGYWYLLVNPGIGVSTQWVFDNYPLTSNDENSTLHGSQIDDAGRFSLDEMENDLERVTMKHYPVVRKIKQALIDGGAVKALMSGSGPTVFGLFVDDDHSEGPPKELVERLRRMYGRHVYLTKVFTGA